MQRQQQNSTSKISLAIIDVELGLLIVWEKKDACREMKISK